MAFRHASGEGESSAPAYMAGRAAELDELRDVLLQLVDRDAEVYEKLVRTPERDAGDALDAFESPLETIESALAALRLLAVGLRHVPGGLLPECAVALHALGAAVEGGAAVCDANLRLLADGERGPRRESLSFLRRQVQDLTREIEEALAARGPAA